MSIFNDNFHLHIHIPGMDTLLAETVKTNGKLDLIIKQNTNIMSALDDIKTKLVTSNEKVDILTTAVTGVKQDTAFLKQKIEDLTNSEGGIDAAGVAELNEIIDTQNAKLTTAADELSALDAETDSSTPSPEA